MHHFFQGLLSFVVGLLAFTAATADEEGSRKKIPDDVLQFTLSLAHKHDNVTGYLKDLSLRLKGKWGLDFDVIPVVQPQGAQFGSFSWPRIIAVTRRAKEENEVWLDLAIAFSTSCDPKKKRTQTVEIIGNTRSKTSLYFAEVDFASKKDIVAHNPKLCVACHAGNFKWQPYAAWPGAIPSGADYGDNGRAITVLEELWVKKYLLFGDRFDRLIALNPRTPDLFSISAGYAFSSNRVSLNSSRLADYFINHRAKILINSLQLEPKEKFESWRKTFLWQRDGWGEVALTPSENQRDRLFDFVTQQFAWHAKGIYDFFYMSGNELVFEGQERYMMETALDGIYQAMLDDPTLLKTSNQIMDSTLKFNELSKLEHNKWFFGETDAIFGRSFSWRRLSPSYFPVAEAGWKVDDNHSALLPAYGVIHSGYNGSLRSELLRAYWCSELADPNKPTMSNEIRFFVDRVC